MPHILVIDDEPAIRAVLREILEQAGYEVTEASNGRVGVDLYRERPADLVITDILMPEKDGIETIFELRSEFPAVKILAMSGGGKGGPGLLLQNARRFGAIRSIRKPFSAADVLTAVRKALAGEE